jgi:CMP-N-acetylneuraminic acid synthetase
LIPRSRTQDIDTEADWAMAESLFVSGTSIKGI